MRFAPFLLAAVSGTALCAAQPCIPHWNPAIGQPGLAQGGPRFVLGAYDGALLAGGLFLIGGAGGLQGLASWNGTAWSPVGGGVGGGTPAVSALATYDPGTGPALYVSGAFTSAGGVPFGHIARWNGSMWTGLGSGLSGTPEPSAYAMAVFDDGSGPALFVGGSFMLAGSAIAPNVAKWNGAFWEPLGSGINGTVYAMAVYDDGTGPGLFLGGAIVAAGGVSASGLVRWRAGAWGRLASEPNGTVYALTVWNGSLYVGGDFPSVGVTPLSRIAGWNGATWSALGAGVDGTVYALTPFASGGASALIAAGNFIFSGNAYLNRIGQWNGGSWSSLAGGANGPVLSLFAQGTSLYAGGLVSRVGSGLESNGVAEWLGCPRCYANCDDSTASPALNINDFLCFVNRFAAGDPYANCDSSTIPPILNVNDFQCFMSRYAAGCN